MKTFKFTWEEIGIEVFKRAPTKYPPVRVRKKFIKNMEIYANWVTITAQKIYKKKLKVNEKFSALGFYMNEKNVDVLYRSLNPGDWLFIAPITLNELKDDEYAVKIKELVQTDF